jgi:hypothetical protein
MSKVVATDSSPVTELRSRWRRRLRIGAIAVLCLAVVGGGYFSYVVRSGQSRLQRVMDELDREDPGWRLEELEAQRKVIPPEQNSARPISAAAALGMPNWPRDEQQQFDKAVTGLSPEVQLPEKALAILRKNLKKSEPALTEARRLADLPYGRFLITYAADGFSTSYAHLRPAREVAELLKHDAMRRSAEGDIDAALASGRGILNAGRSMYDEPSLIVQLARTACCLVALKSIERSLAQGEPSEAALNRLRRLLEEEEAFPVMLVAARGERAIADRFLQALRSGQVPSVMTVLGTKPGRFQIGNFDAEDLAYRYYFKSSSGQHAALLVHLNELVEITKLPIEEQAPRLAQFDISQGSQPLLVRSLMYSTSKIGDAVLRSKAGLRCALVAIALERYRRVHGRWPDSLAALVLEYLPCVPIDPYDGAPLRFRRLADRVVVYSVSLDRQDNGGNITDNPTIAGADLGFRLWDVNRRRQPAKKAVATSEVGPR